MKKSCVVWLILIAKACLAGIIMETSKARGPTPDLVEATVQLLKCYKNQTNVIGFAGKTPKILLDLLWSQEPFSIAVANDASKKVNNCSSHPKSQYKLRLFVISASSATRLEKIVREISDSPWWNHMASFFIVDWSTASKTGCPNVSKLLWTAWELDMLNAKVVCLRGSRGSLIFTYNPYTSHAPDHWHLENTLKGRNDHPWNLFVRQFPEENNNEICRDLDFEKTRNLGGYEVRSTVKEIPDCWKTDTEKSGIDSFAERDGIIARYIFRALNATPNLRTHKITAGPGYSSGETADITVELTNGTSDIVLNPRGQFVRENIAMTYPRSYVRMYIATQSRGIESQLSKILSVIDNSSRFAFFTVVLITLALFKLLLRQSLMTAILNLMRIVLNSSLLRIPKNSPLRIYLASFFFLCLTIVAIFQGKMASVLTMQQPVRNVDTLQDLLELNYTVYGADALSFMLFSDPVFRGRYVGLSTLFCLEYVFRNHSAACISTREYLSSSGVTIGRKLHVSKREIMSAIMVYLIRKNWPLEQRLNVILRRLTEGYIIQKTDMKAKGRAFDEENFFKKLAEQERFSVITLDELGFAFVILGIGITCASACFVAEVTVKRTGLHLRCNV